MPLLRVAQGCACCSPVLGRRGFLGAASALAATAVVGPSFAQETPHRIDVHHHLSPPAWVSALKKAKMDSPPVNKWTPEHSLAEMDRGGIATSVLSITQPALSFLPAKDAAVLARECNEYAKTLVDKYKGRFAFFAALPMPHVDETLEELTYAMDVLGASGAAFMTSYDTKYLGDDSFMPVMRELDRRHAVAYTHPTGPACCVNLGGLPDVGVEFGTDTTRTIGNLIYSGNAAKLPNVQFIFSHGGGTVTSLTERFLIQMPNYPAFPQGKAFNAALVQAQLSRFHYDTAQASNEVILSALTKMVPTSQIVFGTDYPYRTAPDQVRGVQAFFHGDALADVERGNALRMMPHLA